MGNKTQDFLLLQALYPPNNLLNLDILISLHCLKKSQFHFTRLVCVLVWVRVASIVCLNTWSLIGRALWEGLEVWSHWRRSVTRGRLGGLKSLCYSQLTLCFVSVSQDRSSQPLPQRHACLPITMFHAMMVMDTSPLEPWAQNQMLFFIIAIVIVSYHSNRKTTKIPHLVLCELTLNWTSIRWIVVIFFLCFSQHHPKSL